MNAAKLIRANEPLKALWELANVIEHDLHCWEDIRDRVDGFDAYLLAFAKDRITCLRIECDRVYEAVLDVQKEQQREAMKEPLEFKQDNNDYGKRQHRKGHGWKENHKS